MSAWVRLLAIRQPGESFPTGRGWRRTVFSFAILWMNGTSLPLRGTRNSKAISVRRLTALSSAGIGLREIDRRPPEGGRKIKPSHRATRPNPRFKVRRENARSMAPPQLTRRSSTTQKLATAIDHSLSAPMEASAVGPLARRVRAYVRSLSNDQRGKFLGEALQSGDIKTLQSVLGAPAYLSGLAPPMAAALHAILSGSDCPRGCA